MFGKTKSSVIEELDLRDESPAETATATLAPVMERAKSLIGPADIDIDVDYVTRETTRLQREHDSLFGIESQAKAEISTKLHSLHHLKRKARASQVLTGEKLVLSNEVLTWRSKYHLNVGSGHAVPVPEVGLFGLDSPHLGIRSAWTPSEVINPALPHKLAILYKDIFDVLVRASSSRFGVTYGIGATFSGVIPTETRQKIKDAQESKVFDDIRLLAEAQWEVETYASPFYADPIVVGLVNDEMWVIDVFDPTPLEDYIAKEFTT